MPKTLNTLIMKAQAYAFFSTLSSGVKHRVGSTYVDGAGQALIEVIVDYEGNGEHCSECGGVHRATIPSEMGYDLDNPPMPTPDKVFVAPDQDLIRPNLN